MNDEPRQLGPESPVYEVLGEWIDIVNAYGRQSIEALAFLADHMGNAEFVRLATASDRLREAFERPTP